MVSEDADGGYSYAAVIGWGKVSVLLVEIRFQELLYKGWLIWQEYSAGRQFSTRDRQFSPGFSLKPDLCDSPLFKNKADKLCSYKIFKPSLSLEALLHRYLLP